LRALVGIRAAALAIVLAAGCVRGGFGRRTDADAGGPDGDARRPEQPGDSRRELPADRAREASSVDPGVKPPRQLAPLSMSTVSSRRPTLRWQLADGTDAATVEICSDAACVTGALAFVATGTSARPKSDLSDGVYWWRLKGKAGAKHGTEASPFWQFFVRAPRSNGVDTAWGNVADLNGDGRADILVGADWGNTVHLYLGTSAGPSPAPVVFAAPAGGAGYFGQHVSTTDVDGDGRPDLFIGAPAAKDAGGTEVGKVFVYLNSAVGIDASAPTVIAGADPKGSFGVLAGVGDVNGDGYGDLAVAAPGAKVGATSYGKVFVFHGSAAGLVQIPATTILSGTPGGLGHSIAAAGDVNGDGYADIVVGTYAMDTAVVYHGGPAGIGSGAKVLKPPPGGGGQFGWSVAGAGDVNGDGYADVLVGALQWNSGKGRAYVFLGAAGGVASTPDRTLEVEGTSGLGHSVSGAGDLNGDGYADLIVNASPKPPAVYVFPGGNTAANPTAVLDPRGSFAMGLAGVGDVDGDGRSEIAVAAPEASPPIVLVYKGTPSGVATTPTWNLSGLAGSHFGVNIGKTY
jgi:hypothetical protein